MNVDNVVYPSKLGRNVQYTLRSHDDSPDALTVIFPGQAYYLDAPLMWYSALAAFEAGSDVLSLEYGFQSNRKSVSAETLDICIEEIGTTLLDFLSSRNYSKIVFISKSIGTLIVTKLLEGEFEKISGHIFQTPLKPTIGFMKGTEHMLVMVGDSDPAFEEQDLEEIDGKENIRIVLFEGADHLLEVKGDFRKSLEYLNKVSVETYNYVRYLTGE